MFCQARDFRRALVLALAVGTVSASVAGADGLLDRVPPDAAAFLYAHNIQSLDNKLVAILAPPLDKNPIVVTPGVVLQVTVGKDVGLDMTGDVLVVANASEHGFERPQLCVWLPVSDYGQFARSLGGKADEAITVVTISGEDVLCAKDDRWAVIADPTQREELAARLAVPPRPAAVLNPYRDWIASQDVAAVLLPSQKLRNSFRDWLTMGESAEPAEVAGNLDDLFSSANEAAGANDSLSVLRRSLRQFVSGSPKLAALALDAELAAIGLRIDEAGNGSVGLRMKSNEASWRDVQRATSPAAERDLALPLLHREGEFSMSAAGYWPQVLTTAFIDAAVRKAIAEEKQQPRPPVLDAASTERLLKTSERAAQDVLGASLFHSPGGPQDGVYTNQFLALRVTSADAFLAHFAEVVRAWNDFSQKAQPAINETFQSEPASFGERKGTRYYLDVAASVGADDTPELRRTMERMFGPDRKLNLFAIAIDSKTVLLAEATAFQTAGVISRMTGTTSDGAGWRAENVAAANQLLPGDSDWRFFISPSGYFRWKKQEFEAMTAEAIGAPVMPQFPGSPPVGIAGSFGDKQMSIDITVPAATIHAAGEYLSKEQ